MIFTFLAGIVGFEQFSQSKTRSDRPLFWTALFMTVAAILETSISLAWEFIQIGGGMLLGLWFLVPLTAFPLRISIGFLTPYLEHGFFRLQIALGPLPLVQFISPQIGLTAISRLPWAIMIRAIAFPLLFVFNLLMLPIVFLFIRIVKRH